MSLANLAQFATKTQTKNATPFYALSLEEARGKVVVRDSRKPANIVEGADVPLSLYAGKIRLSLDVISEGSTGVTVPVDQVEAVKAQLEEALQAGEFDKAIEEAQAKGKAAAEQAAASKAANAGNEATETEAPAEVDLDELG